MTTDGQLDPDLVAVDLAVKAGEAAGHQHVAPPIVSYKHYSPAHAYVECKQSKLSHEKQYIHALPQGQRIPQGCLPSNNDSPCDLGAENNPSLPMRTSDSQISDDPVKAGTLEDKERSSKPSNTYTSPKKKPPVPPKTYLHKAKKTNRAESPEEAHNEYTTHSEKRN